MHLKTLLRQVGALLIITVLCSTSVSAKLMKQPYGSRTYDLKSEEITALSDVSENKGTLTFDPNGTAEFDFLLPFDAEYLEVTYGEINKPVELTLVLDENTYTGTLTVEATTYQIPIREFYGSKFMKLSASAPVSITKLTYQDVPWVYSKANLMNCDLTDYEYEVSNSVIVKSDAAVMKSQGAIRWFDLDNRFLTPMSIDGSLYVPLQVFASELSLYCEDYADKKYVLLRGERDSLALFDGKGYLEGEFGDKTDVSMNIIYEGGKTWVPLRQLAELFDFYVAYRDGYAVIDDRITAKNILTNEEFFAELQNELSAYIPPAKEAVTGKTYHVAKTANAKDTNPGTEAQPFLTLNKAGEVAQAGDTVIVHEGTYREYFQPKNDGTAFAPITFRAADGEKPVISALEPLTNMVEDKSTGLWHGHVASGFPFGRNQLFYNGKALNAGRHPNTDTHPKYQGYSDTFDDVWPIAGNIAVPVKGGSYAVSDTDLDQPDNYWKGGTFITFKGEAWTMVSGDITGSRPGRIDLKDHDESRSYSLGLKGSEAHGGFKFFENVHPSSDWGYITNHVHTIDLPGEWCIDRDGLLSLLPPEGAVLNEGFEVKMRQQVVSLSNRKYVTLDGINTIGGGMTMNGDATEGNVLTNAEFKNLSHISRYTDSQKGLIDTDVARNADGPAQWGELGIYIAGKNNSVTNCSIHYSAGPAIMLSGLYTYIYNNDIINCSYMPGYLSPLTWMPKPDKQGSSVPRGGDMVIYNTIDYAGRSAVSFFGADMGGGFEVEWYDGNSLAYIGGEFAYNYCGHYGIGTTDTGGYYFYATNLGNDKSFTNAHHNVFGPMVTSSSDRRMMVAALYADSWSSGAEGYQNLSYHEDPGSIGDQQFYLQPNIDGGSACYWQNNRMLGLTPGGLEALTASDYPDGKAFHTGSFLDGKRFMMNYDELSSDVERNIKPNEVIDATDSEGNRIGKTYRFNNLNLPSDGYNYLTLYAKVSEFAANEQSLATAVVTDASEKEVARHDYNLIFTGNNWWMPGTVENCVVLPKIGKGTYNVELTIRDTRVDVFNMRVDELADQTQSFIDNSNVLQPGTWDEALASCPNGDAHLPLGKNGEGMQVGNLLSSFKPMILWNAWDHTAVYKDRTTTETYSGISYTYTTGNPYAGAVVELYVDSLDNEPIATTTFTAHPEAPLSWTKQTQYIKFTRPLEPGTYTFYLKFNGCGTCSSIYETHLLTADALKAEVK